MFTGIISNTAKITRIDQRKDTRFVFETDGELVDLDIGGSVACSGVCLTAVEIGNGTFAADVSNEQNEMAYLQQRDQQQQPQYQQNE